MVASVAGIGAKPQCREDLIHLAITKIYNADEKLATLEWREGHDVRMVFRLGKDLCSRARMYDLVRTLQEEPREKRQIVS